MKRKLLLATLCVVGALGMRAQTWTSGSEVATGEYYLYNVGADRYLNTGSSWSTHCTADGEGHIVTISAKDDGYKLGTTVSGGQGPYVWDNWMNNDKESTDNKWIFTKVDVTGYENAYVLQMNSTEGKYMYWAGGGSGSYGNEVLCTETIGDAPANFYWLLIPKTTRQNLAAATVANPLDVTYLIKNADFEGNINNGNSSATGWTVGGFKQQNTAQSFANAIFMEKWASGGLTTADAIYQTPTLTAGTYRLMASAYASCTQAFLYAGELAETQITTNGIYSITFTMDSEAAIQLGVKIKAGGTGSWVAFDNVRLYYLGNVSKTELKAAIDEAAALTYADTYNTTAKAVWQSYLTTANTVYANESATTDEVLAATENLAKANEQIEAIIAAYTDGTAADFTLAIANPSFETGDYTGWTTTVSKDTGVYPNSNATYAAVGTDGNYLFNTWWTGFPLYQTVAKLPNGVYELTAKVTTDNETTRIYITADDAYEPTQTGTKTQFYNASIRFTVLDNDVKIGVVGGNADGTYNAEGYFWYKADDFHLNYLGNTVSNSMVSELIATVPSGIMNGDVETALTTAKATLEGSKTFDNYVALQTAISNANASIAAYSNANTQLTNVKAVIDELDVNSYTAASLATNYTNVKNAYDARTLSDDDATAYTYGTRYTGAVPSILLSTWTMGGTPATTDGSGLYINTWSTEGNSDGSNVTTPFFEYFAGEDYALAAKTLEATLTGLKASIRYKASILLRVRQQKDQIKADDDVTMQVGSGEIKNAADGTQGTGDFERMYYKTAIAIGYTDAEGNLSVKLNVKDGNHIHWLAFKNMEIEEYNGPTDEEAAALADAIDAVDDYVVGFEDGEYAPYNNYAAITALATAQDVQAKVEARTATASEVTEATSALSSAIWTANVGEVNAVYDGTFATATNNGAPAGWTMSNNTLGGDYHSRAFVGDERLTEFNETNSGLFLRFDDTNSSRGSMYYYGNTNGYTMPLKADTKYYVKVDFTNWGTTNNRPLRLNVTGPTGFSAIDKTVYSSKNADSGNDAPDQIVIEFTATVAGNYAISFQCPGGNNGNNDNKHNVIVSNIDLYKQASATMSITSAKYATFCAPFDVAIPEGVTASTVTGVENNVLTLSTVETTIPANTPVILYKEDVEEETFTNTVYGKSTAEEDSYTVGWLTGVYEATPAPAGSYVLQNNNDKVGFYVVEEGKEPTVGANRAYLKDPESGAKPRAFFFNADDATAIATIAAMTAGEVEGIYTIGGAKVLSLQKGVNILKMKNGQTRKVIVK